MQEITCSAEFTSATTAEARYSVAALHFFKAAMKMGFGENDKNRGKSSFKNAIEAIQLCKSWGLTTRVKAVITQNNISSLDFLCDFAKKEDVEIDFSDVVSD